MIAIIDYGMGNLRSVAKALEAAGAKRIKVTSDVKTILKADKVVLPGVGAMQEGMRELKRLGLVEAIKEKVFKNPFLGICLGLQLLFTESQEGGRAKGLGIFEGKVKRFSNRPRPRALAIARQIDEPGKLKVPHMGWNNIRTKNSELRTKKCFALNTIPDNSYFYFCHSYYVAPKDKSIIAATTDYGGEFVCAICKDNLFACQFHPEKSQESGLRLLKNFVNI